MQTYLALLRGVNVGGKGMLKMSELQNALTNRGLHNVRTYIQSGNVVFDADEISTAKLAITITSHILKQFNLAVDVVVVAKADWQAIIADAPAWWGDNDAWKHNLLVMIPPYSVSDVLNAVKVKDSDIEIIAGGKGVLYQSISIADFSRGETSKLIASPIYKHMTIRNYNTAIKLLNLLG